MILLKEGITSEGPASQWMINPSSIAGGELSNHLILRADELFGGISHRGREHYLESSWSLTARGSIPPSLRKLKETCVNETSFNFIDAVDYFGVGARSKYSDQRA